MPYPNEHACRLMQPVKGAKYRRGTQGNYSVIYMETGGSWKQQAYRYKSAFWSADAARKH